MGQANSRRPGSSNAGSTGACDAKKCYYAVLGIEPQASDDEIKKAYRRKALKLHPDRNFGNVDDATISFAEVQVAYEVLSDPQERAWYDSHRDVILQNNRGDSDIQYQHNVPVTTTEDITRMYMSFDGRFEFSDVPSGFYTVIRELFNRLAREEEMVSEWDGLDSPSYPSFGSSRDTYEDTVKSFYAMWSNFSTQKSFSWKDVYRYNEAPDRRTRRVMEKENRRFREDGIRDFNNSVRALVAYVRKRDPRYTPNTRSYEESQKILRDMAAAQAAKSRAENMAKVEGHQLSDWARPQESEELDERVESEEEQQEEYECVICQKVFKSEKQYEAHEKSKKHTKASQQLRRQMRKENIELGLADDPTAVPTPPETNETTDESSEGTVDAGTGGLPPNQTARTGEPEQHVSDSEDSSHREPVCVPALNVQTSAPAHPNGDSEDDDDAPREEVEQRILSTGCDTSREDMTTLTDSVTAQHLESTRKPKLGKAKEKKAKKAEAQKVAEKDTPGANFQCAACQSKFPSRTQLFNHIKHLEHATPVRTPGKNNARKR